MTSLGVFVRVVIGEVNEVVVRRGELLEFGGVCCGSEVGRL